ncbi:MAG: RNA ligase family protein [Chthoniobacteraceae bacterium]
MEAFSKFPKTPHLLWLSSVPARNDKVMTFLEAKEFLSGTVVVEEKVDGANLGLSFDNQGTLKMQNRGNFLSGSFTGQWERLRGWLAGHEFLLRKHLPSSAILFGEWCYAQHSIAYTLLPDWFLGFDVFDVDQECFWSTDKRDELLAEIGLVSVHRVASGRFTFSDVQAMLFEPSAYYCGPVEGIYLRRENEWGLERRAKLVRAEFVQAIEEHWSNLPLRANQVTVPRPA